MLDIIRVGEYMKKKVMKLLAKWAHEIWLREKPMVIGITGSIAKTSTKEAIFLILEKEYPGKVFCTPGNLNNEFGLPLGILGFKRSAKAYEYLWILPIAYMRRNRRIGAKYWVLEMGADKPGDIKYLTSIIKPNMAVVTAVGMSHLGQLRNIGGVWEEKADLVRAVDEDGAVFLNENYKITKLMANETKAKVYYFGGELDQIAQGAARTIGKYLGISESRIEEGIEGMKSERGRMHVFKGRGGATIIDDTYNANPLSMEIGLYVLHKMARQRDKKRKIAILGDMLDLGQYGREAHKDLEKILEQSADCVIGVGSLMKGVSTDEWYEDSKSINSQILNNLKSDDIILVKGSRGMKMERIVHRLESEE